ncbi:Alpha/Beta hydrolase protein [Hyaloraphidium curvatum]|nr:Alpha/Beta hydrolase protein [Hyaloraphidium curvatum]
MLVTLPSHHTLSYSVSGPSGPEVPTVVFLHALFMDKTMWEHQIASLDSTFRCISIDLRGFGDTPAAGPFTTADVVEDVVGLLDHLGIRSPVTIVGVSQGGWLAVEAAAKHEDRVRAIVVMSSSTRKQSPESLEALKGLRKTWAEEGFDTILPAFIFIAFGDGDKFTDQKEIKRWRDAAVKRGAESYNLAFDSAMGRSDLEEQLANLSKPTLILHGDLDRSFPVNEAYHTLDKINKDALKGFFVIKHGAHVLPVTNPEAVTPLLASFLHQYASNDE